MRSKNVVTERDKCLIGAFSAFDLRLAADASDPLIATHRRVARLSALRIFPPARKHLLSPSEQAPEERDLRCRRRGRCHPGGESGWVSGRLCDLRMPAAMRRPSALPWMAVPFRNCACVQTEATVVNSGSSRRRIPGNGERHGRRRRRRSPARRWRPRPWRRFSANWRAERRSAGGSGLSF
jgi:hypothetical protein